MAVSQQILLTLLKIWKTSRVLTQLLQGAKTSKIQYYNIGMKVKAFITLCLVVYNEKDVHFRDN